MSGQSDDECGGCSRRTLLQGLLVSLPVIAAGCGNDSELTPDAGTNPDGGDGAGFELCGTDLCIDLMHSTNAGLSTVGGNRVFTTTKDKIMVVRSTATTFTTLSALCTHAKCTVRYALATDSYACPCHGSKFDSTGAVTRGPAASPLKHYTNTFDDTAATLTVKL
ncbi:MAG: Rieske (2Fe-2S) domain protein [Deltaproteobacteria bacterium]|nr:Rieske (2Fe-2S) domain protein [Deltaproteobacteria bacterium]